MIHSEVNEKSFWLVHEACKKEPIPILGLLGEWDYCASLWNYFKAVGLIHEDLLYSKEVLFSLPLVNDFGERPSFVRLLRQEEYAVWKPLRLLYLAEEQIPSELDDVELEKQFCQKVKDKVIWGGFDGNQLVSIAELNAKGEGVGVVGGVFTLPSHRRRQYARAVMRYLLSDAQKKHALHQLIIFSGRGDKNLPARRLYESLGAQKVGYFALLFGR